MTDAKSNYFEGGLAGLVFNATSIASLAQDSSGGGAANLYVALHTASPTDTPTSGQNDNEAAYTSYARVAVERTSSGWTVTTAGVVSPTTNITFPQATGGTETITHFSVSLSSVSNTPILYYGTVTPNISVSNGVTPRLTTATQISET
jgi:hypothetical protein